MKLAAVIVDTRNLPGLVKTIKDHLRHLPDRTMLFWNANFEFRNSDLTKEFVEKNPVEILYTTWITEIEHYNRVLTTPEFWKRFQGYDRVLIFQYDSMLLCNGIEEFYPYDYVGAPWQFQIHGGNGGLSLRNPKVMMEICEKFKWSANQGNEDVWFSNIMHDHKIGNLAPREVAEKFSCESIFSLGTVGYHAIDKWLSPAQCEQIKNQYSNT